jgi:hypothetical protein
MQAVNLFGRIIKIDERRTFDLHVRASERSLEGFYFLYIIPFDGQMNDSGKEQEEVSTGVSFYQEPYILSTSDDNNTGILLCRFKMEGKQIEVSDDFIPSGVFIDSSEMSVQKHDLLIEQFDLWNSKLEAHLLNRDWNIALEQVQNTIFRLLRDANYFRPLIQYGHTQTVWYFKILQQYFNLVKVNLQLLVKRYEDGDLIKKTMNVINGLNQLLTIQTGKQYDLGPLYNQTVELLMHLIDLSEEFPDAPRSIKPLTILDVDFDKGAIANKLFIRLKEDAHLNIEKSRVTFELRKYSKTDPIDWDIRFAIGNDSFARLDPIENCLKRDSANHLCYKIDLDMVDNRIKKPNTMQFTLWVPHPIAEGLSKKDLADNMTIIVRD